MPAFHAHVLRGLGGLAARGDPRRDEHAEIEPAGHGLPRGQVRRQPRWGSYRPNSRYCGDLTSQAFKSERLVERREQMIPLKLALALGSRRWSAAPSEC